MRRHRFTSVAAAFAVAASATATATATVTEHGRFAEEAFEFGYDCGFQMEVAGVASGNYRLRDGGDGMFFSLDRISFHETHTNTQTGEWFTLSGRFASNETRARHVEGSLHELHIVKAGQVAVIRDSDGDLISRDRGAVRRTVLFDTGGDAEPGGQVVDLIDLDLAGPHESLGDLCAIAAELTTDG